LRVGASANTGNQHYLPALRDLLSLEELSAADFQAPTEEDR
jgi:hypothetical protein